MNNTVICVWNTANKGKSGSIFEVYSQLLAKGAIVDVSISKVSDYDNPHKTDNEIVAVMDYCGLKIGVESQGDPYGRQFHTLPDLKKLGCNIIVCASRTSGGTCDLVYEIAGTNYDLIWFSNFYFDSNRNQSRYGVLRSFNAKVVVDLIDELIAGKI